MNDIGEQGEVRSERRRAGIKPYLPPPEERPDILLRHHSGA